MATWLLSAPTIVFAQSERIPLVRYDDARWPFGPPIGSSFGVAFVDYDRDGWPDLYSHFSGNLWHNEKGHTWRMTANLHDFMPPTAFRYGASCGDYDNDGWPDVATEQYGDCFYLLRNLGQVIQGVPQFVEVASDPTIVTGQPCGMYSETACWADVDDDDDLDLFVPAYPDRVIPGSGGNRFWRNLGPDALGTYRLSLETPAAGLLIPPTVQRPEGAQFCDVDRDGDPDLFSNHTLYQNNSKGVPAFTALGLRATNIAFPNQLDEGALFFDYDLDGDQDLLVVYIGVRNRLWENRGDGTFFSAEDVLEVPAAGAFTGASAEDWDQDGDVDLTTAAVFRRNLRVETGERRLHIVPHSLPPETKSPAWADWDRDGDPDCVLLGPNASARLFRNVTYGGGARNAASHSLRVRVVRDAPGVPGGLETEFGATVEVRVHGDTSGFVRRRFVASSHGYLQQDEYALTLALPPGPDPTLPGSGVFFDLLVDFPGRPDSGILRVDRSVNPLLGALQLAKVAGRELTIFRSGKVELDGLEYAPRDDSAPRLFTTGAGPPLPAPTTPLPDPSAAPAPSWFVGVELDTLAAPGPVRVEELILDGRLDLAAPCSRKPFNVALWDVSAAGAPRRVWQASLATEPRNRRSFLPVAFELERGRRFRLVCRVTELRAATIVSPGTGPLRVAGGLSFGDDDPCSGASAAGAALDAAREYLWLRFRGPGPSRTLTAR